MTKAANKRKRNALERPKQRSYTRAELVEWNTGYSDPALQQAAIQNGSGKGSQKVKRDKLKHQIRIGNGLDSEDNQRYRHVNAERATGSFLEPNESKSYIQPGGYSRAVNHPSRMANENSPHGDSRIIPTPEATRFVHTIK